MFMVVVYNPLSRPVSTYVRVPVQGNSYVVRSLTDGMYMYPLKYQNIIIQMYKFKSYKHFYTIVTKYMQLF